MAAMEPKPPMAPPAVKSKRIVVGGPVVDTAPVLHSSRSTGDGADYDREFGLSTSRSDPGGFSAPSPTPGAKSANSSTSSSATSKTTNSSTASVAGSSNASTASTTSVSSAGATAATTTTAGGAGGKAPRPKTPAGSGIHAAAAISKKSLLSRTYTAKFVLGTEGKAQAGTEVFCVRYSPNGKLIAASSGDSTIKVFNSATGGTEYILPPQIESAMPTTCVRWRPSKTAAAQVLLAADASGHIVHWEVGTRAPQHVIHQKDNQVFALDYMEDGSTFASAGYDRVVRVYDEATKEETRQLGGGFVFGGRFKTGHSNRVFSLKFSSTDPNLLLSGGWDNTIQIWDLRNVHPVRSIFGPHICGDSVDLRGNTVLTGSWRLENPLQMWDLPSGKLLRTVPFSATDNTCCVYAAQFSKDQTFSRICAGGSGTHEARLFETHTGDVVGRITGMTQGVYSVDFHPTIQQLVVGSGDGTVRIVDFPT